VAGARSKRRDWTRCGQVNWATARLLCGPSWRAIEAHDLRYAPSSLYCTQLP